MGLEIARLLREGFWSDGDCLELADAVSKTAKFSSVEGTDVRKPDEPAREPVHLWLDFSRPEATLQLLAGIDTPLLIGTTGFTDVQLRKIEAYAAKAPVLLASNTSAGMSQFKKWIHSGVPAGKWDVVLEEEHHREKMDSPSGSAKTLLALLAKKGVTDVSVNAVRAGTIKGVHTVRFISDDEEILIQHRVFDRQTFALGALRGGLGLLKKGRPGLYGMEDVL